DSSMWEDWALFLKLVSRGHRVSVVPQGTMLYRCRAVSMSRTAPRFPAEWRLGRAAEGLPRFEAFRLLGALRSLEQERNAALTELSQAREDLAALRIEHGRLRNRLGRDLMRLIERQPGFYNRLRALVDTTKVTVEHLTSRWPNGKGE